MKKTILLISLLLIAACSTTPRNPVEPPVSYNAQLAEELGADDYGMRSYVLAILKTGSNDANITDKEKRKQLFAGHFSNMQRLAKEDKLVLAGPLGGEMERRGIFILNTPDIETAKTWTATDPTVQAGVFEIEYMKYYGSAALMKINEIHQSIQKNKVD